MNFASVYNYYEHLVFSYIRDVLTAKYENRDEEFFLDVACYSLTRLPSRYIRHEIDMIYYLAPGERTEMENRVSTTIESAAEFINERLEKNSKKEN